MTDHRMEGIGVHPIDAHTTFGQYQVLEIIGHGGMATVYKAWEPDLDRIVAIKVLLPVYAGDTAFRARFQREARVIARLKHAHIVGIYGVGETQGLPYLVMEFLQGPTLHTMIRERYREGNPFSPAEVLDVLQPLAEALDYAHSRDVIHRDLKPENIIVTANGPVITDFGLAKLVQGETPTVSIVMGTPSYMAPEQIRSESVDRRTDIYALGVLTCELLTGAVPFTGPSPYAVAQAHVHTPPPALVRLNPQVQVPPLVEEVVQRAIAKRKGDRWPSAGAMVAAFARAIERSTGQPSQSLLTRPAVQRDAARPAAQPVGPPSRLKPPPNQDSRIGRLVLIVPLIVLALAALWGVSVLARVGAPPTRQAEVVVTSATGETPAPGESAAPSTPSASAAPSAVPLAAVSAVATIGPTASPDSAVRAIVTAPTGAFLRSGPGTAYPAIAGLPDGATVIALHRLDGWYEVRAPSGEQGWIAGSLIQIQSGDAASLQGRDVAPPPVPTNVRPTVVVAAATPSSASVPAATSVTIEDTAFTGGFRNRGASVYGGRTATWIYGQGSGYNTMGASFDLQDPAGRGGTLTIIGMDSEDTAKTRMRVEVNGVAIFEGANPLPNDDQPLETGRWDNLNLTIPSGVLRPGSNTLSITNLARGSVGLPPFVAVDNAVVTLR